MRREPADDEGDERKSRPASETKTTSRRSTRIVNSSGLGESGVSLLREARPLGGDVPQSS